MAVGIKLIETFKLRGAQGFFPFAFLQPDRSHQEGRPNPEPRAEDFWLDKMDAPKYIPAK
jgi:hypothetical protein